MIRCLILSLGLPLVAYSSTLGKRKLPSHLKKPKVTDSQEAVLSLDQKEFEEREFAKRADDLLSTPFTHINDDFFKHEQDLFMLFSSTFPFSYPEQVTSPEHAESRSTTKSDISRSIDINTTDKKQKVQDSKRLAKDDKDDELVSFDELLEAEKRNIEESYDTFVEFSQDFPLDKVLTLIDSLDQNQVQASLERFQDSLSARKYWSESKKKALSEAVQSILALSDSKSTLSARHIRTAFEHFSTGLVGTQLRLPIPALFVLFKRAMEVFSTEPSLLEIKSNSSRGVLVFGDLHG